MIMITRSDDDDDDVYLPGNPWTGRCLNPSTGQIPLPMVNIKIMMTMTKMIMMMTMMTMMIRMMIMVIPILVTLLATQLISGSLPRTGAR